MEAEKKAGILVDRVAKDFVELLREIDLTQEEFYLQLIQMRSFNLGLLLGMMQYLPMGSRPCEDMDNLLCEIDWFLEKKPYFDKSAEMIEVEIRLTVPKRSMQFRLDEAEQIIEDFKLEVSE
jgi:hypothetical protein